MLQPGVSSSTRPAVRARHGIWPLTREPAHRLAGEAWETMQRPRHVAALKADPGDDGLGRTFALAPRRLTCSRDEPVDPAPCATAGGAALVFRLIVTAGCCALRRELGPCLAGPLGSASPSERMPVGAGWGRRRAPWTPAGGSAGGSAGGPACGSAGTCLSGRGSVLLPDCPACSWRRRGYWTRQMQPLRAPSGASMRRWEWPLPCVCVAQRRAHRGRTVAPLHRLLPPPQLRHHHRRHHRLRTLHRPRLWTIPAAQRHPRRERQPRWRWLRFAGSWSDESCPPAAALPTAVEWMPWLA